MLISITLALGTALHNDNENYRRIKTQINKHFPESVHGALSDRSNFMGDCNVCGTSGSLKAECGTCDGGGHCANPKCVDGHIASAELGCP